MRIGVFSDVHSNFEALRCSFQALQTAGCDRFVCLGDVVGYGAQPRECIDFIREREIFCIRGNHDQYTTEPRTDWMIQPYARDAIFWTQDHLGPAEIRWLSELPFDLEFEGMNFVHASLECHDGEYWPYILSTKAAIFHFFFQQNRYAFFGHTHIPLLFVQPEGHEPMVEFLSSRSLEAVRDNPVKFLLNPGSVGQPRDFDHRSSVLVFDTEKDGITLLRVEYDVEKTQNLILAAGLPAMLAHRLSRGS
jgi:predicted phosphodiesterase